MIGKEETLSLLISEQNKSRVRMGSKGGICLFFFFPHKAQCGLLSERVPAHCLMGPILLRFAAVQQMAAEGQSDMEVCMERRGGIEFLHVEKNGTH